MSYFFIFFAILCIIFAGFTYETIAAVAACAFALIAICCELIDIHNTLKKK